MRALRRFDRLYEAILRASDLADLIQDRQDWRQAVSRASLCADRFIFDIHHQADQHLLRWHDPNDLRQIGREPDHFLGQFKDQCGLLSRSCARYNLAILFCLRANKVRQDDCGN